MKLLIDSGNSRLKWAFVSEGGFRPQPPVAGGRAISSAGLNRLWGRLRPVPSQVWIANVGGDEVAAILTGWIESHWRLSPRFVTSRAEGYGVASAYTEPHQLGVDRWLALVGTCHHHPLPACIIDCGTAVTIDVIDKQGQHRGGVISPGLRLMAQSLNAGTAGVGLKEMGVSAADILADGTSPAVGLGIRHAVSGMIERVIMRLGHELPGLNIILTGGDAAEIASFLSVEMNIVPDLVLQGLAEVSRWE